MRNSGVPLKKVYISCLVQMKMRYWWIFPFEKSIDVHKCVNPMIIRNISFIVNQRWIVQHVKEIIHVQLPYPVKIICNVTEKPMHQLISLLNIPAHKVNHNEMKQFSNDCSLVHTMCTNNMPLRNTLYGYIVSPGYPYPMADNLKCSLSIGRNCLSRGKEN